METINEIEILQLDVNELKLAVQQEYTNVVCNQNHVIHFTSGWPLARRLGYPESILKTMPSEAIRPFAGVGNPFQIGSISEGEKILDIGCGAGLDCLLASIYTDHLVEVFGLDMTEAMLEQARKNAAMMGMKTVHFIHGQAENIPLPSESIDVVISNGVINLCLDKAQVFRQIYRVLKPGGRFQIADVLLERPVPVASRNLVHLWTNCVAGAIPREEYIKVITTAGFEQVQIKQEFDVFNDARVAKSAAYFGARGYNIIAVKPIEG
ncbi:MAG: methyltransferase domain-containing protein [Candidatus Cyclobacteriaceae bacterium M3_2C_046]